MADLTLNSQLIVPVTPYTQIQRTAGDTINAGEPAYYNSGDGNWYRARAGGNSMQSGALGIAIAINTAYAGQPIQLFTQGNLYLGAANAAANGQIYCVSYNSGKIAPAGDLNSACYTTVLGVVTTNSNLKTCSSLLASNSLHP